MARPYFVLAHRKINKVYFEVAYLKVQQPIHFKIHRSSPNIKQPRQINNQPKERHIPLLTQNTLQGCNDHAGYSFLR